MEIMKTNKDNFIRSIRLELADGNTELIDLAATTLADMFNQGYIEYTEHPKLAELARPYTCEYCNRLHKLSECSSYGVDEYRRLGRALWTAKYITA